MWKTSTLTKPGCPTLRSIPFYGSYHAMGKNRARPKQAMVYATQSIHKLLAGISQASQVLVQDSQTVKLDKHLFNEAYLMHTSTSPQYSIIASCDVAAAMMEPPGGTALVEESIAEALDFRRAMRKVDEEYGDDWWFKVWGPGQTGRGRHWPLRRLDHQGRIQERQGGCQLARLWQDGHRLQHAGPDQVHHRDARAWI
jgi:arginine/lysine/ornithine decarboxylase